MIAKAREHLHRLLDQDSPRGILLKREGVRAGILTLGGLAIVATGHLAGLALCGGAVVLVLFALAS